MVSLIERPTLPGLPPQIDGHSPRSVKWVSSIIRFEKLDVVTEALNKLNLVGGMTVTDLRGSGHEVAERGLFHGTKYSLGFLQRVKIELAIDGDDLAEVEKIISELARTGEVGDGKIFVFKINDLIRIRTSEKGISAL